MPTFVHTDKCDGCKGGEVSACMYIYRADFPDLDEENWHCFVNSRMDPETGDWNLMRRDWVGLVDHGH